MLIILLFTGYFLGAQSFTPSTLSGVNLTSPTTLQFGPDGRLYVAQQDGTIFAYTIQKNGPNNYQVTATETIQDIKQIQNHDDDGSVNSAETDRQVTGILVTGTASNPVLYVSSSDPRIGGGESGGIGDVNLDTNSGVISKLTWDGSDWVKVDVVKGLPRSEENHAVNGMQLDESTNTLYLAQGGNTNAGSPSVNFTYITEYALAAAVLSIDLDLIDSDFGGSYDLPTLDDPSRANSGPGGSDVGDPFGGNDGLNQAKLVPGGPVQVYSPGFRNIYDLVLTRTAGIEGRLYTIDNGANAGWGGHPENEGTPNVTNNYVPGEPGSQGPGPNDGQVNNLDHLHLVSAPGFGPIYGGHPNPVRANPAGAGLYRRDATNQEFFELNPTVDWPPVPLSMANPVEADFQNPGVDDGALYTWGASTNGMAEYTATNFFGGAMTGDLLAASFDGKIYRIELSADGKSTTSVSVFASGFGSTPLDVTAQGTGEVFEGTVWAVTYVGEKITIFEPDVPADDGWTIETSSNNPTERHENAYVEAGGLFYLIGGRGNKPLDIYDPVAQTWSTGSAPPFEMHHFQAISYQGDIYVMGGFTGDYPGETPLTNVYIYDPDTDNWTTGPAIPRARGSAGVVVYNDHIYMVGGIQNGHIDGWVPWLDEFDPATNTWTTLPDAPRARDHFQAAVVGGKLYAVGGRRTNEGAVSVFTPTVPEVDVYDFNTSSWSTLPGSSNIPTERAGAATVVINGTIVVIGGETGPQNTAHDETEALDPNSNIWTILDPLNTGRHGTQALTHNGKIYIAAGSENRGGGPELFSQEFLSFVTSCSGDPNDYAIDDDSDGYSNGDETLNGTDPCSAASRPPDNDGDFLSDLLDDDDDNDGLPDTTDAFALDQKNGQSTSLPIDYPFLNGNPGFGLFGLGYTGLMTNNSTDYLELFDENNPGLIMGGASGVATVPASSGDALTNDQEYAFQFGININSTSNIFIIRSALEGTPFFNGIFQDQSQGIYIGNGDQDNYLKVVLAANNGNGAFQILAENNGTEIVNTLIPVANILSESEITLYLEIDPGTGTVQPRYSTGSDPTQIDIGTPISLTGNVLNALQGPEALAVGLIATSGTAPSFQASWDFIEVELDPLFQAIYRINSGGPAFSFNGENWQADQYNDANVTYPPTPNPIDIANTTNDQLYHTEVNSSTGGFTYNIPITNGEYTVNLHFAEIFFGVVSGGGVGSRVFNVDVENGQGQLTNYDIVAAAGGPATAIVETFNNIMVTDGSLTIVYTSITDRAKSSGIEIIGNSSPAPPEVFNPGNQLLNPGESASIQVFASDPNPDDNITYVATGLPASLSIDGATGLITGTITDPIGDYDVTVRATDDAGLFSEESFTVSINNFQSLYKINSGGPAFSFGGEDWMADQYNNGQSFINDVPIANTLNDELYQSESYGNTADFSYMIPIPVSGTYAVRLHFAEVFHGVENSSGIGARIFNMEIEDGQAQLTNYDIVKESGAPATAISVAFPAIQVNDGVLNIDFLASVDNPKVSGIEVFNIAGPPLSPVVFQPGDQFYNNGDQVDILINGKDPNLGDVLTFSADGLPSPLSIDGASGMISGVLADADGTYSVTVRATDEGGLFDEKTFDITIGNYASLYRINAGGPAYTYNGENWLADQFGDAGGSYPPTPNPLPIAGTVNDELYQTEAFDNSGSFSYEIPVLLDGAYAVKIHFAEIFHGVQNSNGVGARVFNVSVEGGQGQLNNFDIIENAGAPATALVAAFNNINVTDGFVSIDFSSTVDNPKVSGIELFAIDQPSVAPVIITPYDQIFISEEGVNMQVNAIDPNIGDNLIYSASGLPNGLYMDQAMGLIVGSASDAPGVYNVTVRVEDQGGLFDEANFIITIGDFTPIYRINSGGPSFTYDGQEWLADQFSNASGQYPVTPNPISISATDNDELYQTESFDNSGAFAYNIPVPVSGEYALRIHFAEIFHGVENNNGTGARIFSVDVEGQEAVTDFDIIAQVGSPATASLIGFSSINVNDGFLTVSFNASVDNPKVSGIELFAISTASASPLVYNPGDQFFSDGELVSIQINAVDPNFGDVLTYTASGLPGGLTIDPGTGEISGIIADVFGDYPVQVTVTDNGGMFAQESFVVTVGDFEPVIRINSGGPAFTFNGEDWSMDQYNDGAGNFSNVIPIASTNNDQLYQTELFDNSGSFTYEIPVANGQYAVRLHFAEIFHGVENSNGQGTRVMNVDLEGGQAQLSNFDIVATTGAPATAYIASFLSLDISDGSLTIAFEGVIENPKISGIEIFELGQNPPVLEPIGNQNVSEGEVLDLTVSASDPDGEIPTLSASGLPSFVSFTDAGDGTGQLLIAPGFTDVGVYPITITASDALGLQDMEEVQITITEVNVAPILAEIPDQTLEEATSVTVTLSATDPDGEVPVLEIINLQTFMNFTDNGDGTGILDISPDYNEFGVFILIVQASDAAGLTDEQQVQVVVTEITGDPEWSVIAEVENANCLDQDGAITLNVSGGFGEKEYAWSNGATTKDLSGLQSGVYSVTITDRKGNQTSGSYTVNAQPGPQKPLVSQDGNFLVSTPAESYQWSFNGEEIEGATDQSVEVTLFGEYSVTVADELGCTIASDPVEVNFGISELVAYPIPTNGDLILEITLDEPEVITFILLNSMGQQTPMGVYDLAAGRHQLSLNFNESYSDGVYMLLNNSKRLESKITRFVLLR